MFLAMGKGAVKLGWRMALVTGLYTSIATSLMTVRGHVNPLDHVRILVAREAQTLQLLRQIQILL